ncbi:cysteine desulfurase [Candidatus Poribacteria bacterium]|nr:cysteine desulfurase [Candidatus Poribacteria bacterium]MYH79688.1 cysteine desulfurase [Candidatus Poribacteria bacterium]MYK93489.1 cysteine desulfurase [Candidatus Poribacteria bacterium]
MNNVIYMDNHATTPIASEVFEVMMPCLTTHFGNASSTHPFGTTAKDAVEKARHQVADLLGCSPEEIIFTSGATESDNLAIRGIAYACREKGNHIITSTAEHHAILDTCHVLAAEGFETTYLPVDKYGMVNPDDVEAAITPKTILMSFMYANNEVGTINPITDIAAVAAKHGVLFHSDAVQGIGQLPSDMEALGLNLASLTAHKIYGPKGIGALYMRRGCSQPHSLFYGGGQEEGVRPGTLNVPGIVGLGAACELSKKHMASGKSCVATLRDALHQKLNAHLDDIHLNGHPEQRLPGNLNLCFAGVQSHAHLAGLKRVAVSTGSACDSESVKASHVLVAMGVPNELALTAVRFGLGRYNTAEEVDIVADEVVKVVNRLRALAPEC